ncbi:hypothetical protein PG987_011806, partial [Apiospora arundinis]
MSRSSITADCIELGNTISRATLVLNEYVRDVREARADLDEVSRELHSLQSVLNLLKDDAPSLPSKIATQTPSILQQCNALVEELDTALLSLDDPELTRPQKRTRWLCVGKSHIADLRDALEAHRTTVGLALDLVGATNGRGLHDSSEGDYFASLENEQRQIEVRGEAIRIIEEMGRLQFRLPEHFESIGTDGHDLQTYFAAIKTYGDSLIVGGGNASMMESGAYIGSEDSSGAYVGDDGPDSGIDVNQGPDSAVDVSDGESSSKSSSAKKEKKTKEEEKTIPDKEEQEIPTHAELYVTEVNTLMEEMMTEDGSIRVPSRSTSRAPSRAPSRSTSRAPSRAPSRTLSRAPSRSLSRATSRAPTPPPKDIKRLDSRRKTMVTPFAAYERPEEAFGVVTEITSSGNAASQHSHRGIRRFGSFSGGVQHGPPVRAHEELHLGVVLEVGGQRLVHARRGPPLDAHHPGEPGAPRQPAALHVDQEAAAVDDGARGPGEALDARRGRRGGLLERRVRRLAGQEHAGRQEHGEDAPQRQRVVAARVPPVPAQVLHVPAAGRGGGARHLRRAGRRVPRPEAEGGVQPRPRLRRRRQLGQLRRLRRGGPRHDLPVAAAEAADRRVGREAVDLAVPTGDAERVALDADGPVHRLLGGGAGRAAGARARHLQAAAEPVVLDRRGRRQERHDGGAARGHRPQAPHAHVVGEVQHRLHAGARVPHPEAERVYHDAKRRPAEPGCFLR